VVVAELLEGSTDDRQVVALGEIARTRFRNTRLFVLGLGLWSLVGEQALGIGVRAGVALLPPVSIQQLRRVPPGRLST
jgi:hypothetical protein